MKVILKRDIRGLGKIYEVKDVVSGYARNFLFPNNLAEVASAAALKKLDNLIRLKQDDYRKLLKHLQDIAQRIKNITLTIPVKANEKGLIYGSVSKETILKGLRQSKIITVERPEIKLNHPLKETGTYTVEVKFKENIKTTLTVKLQPQR